IEGFGSVTVTVDGEPHGALEIPGPGIYELAAHERHGSHTVTLIPEAGMSVWSVSFDPGLP
ncbi:MAG: hypothetical protein JST59_17240, partial [Actinobacteria bacterium]|nr:hypothetical protein [Actinomycetota bacterium]